MTKATFTNIRQQILSQIRSANTKITVAVAWFTSMDLLGELTDKLKQGCEVEIIISDHFENQRLSFGALIREGGKIYILRSQSGKFLHEKFAVFDNKLVIAGSYNWTNSAEFYNHEFVIQSLDTTLVKQFNFRFEKLKKIVIEYDKQCLVVQDNLTAETKEDEFIQLENDLAKDFIETVREANSLDAKISEKIVENYIYSYGAIGAATRLINAGAEFLHSGLVKLFEINRLDLSFEAIVLKEKYKGVFSEEVKINAINRLKALNYNI